MFQHLRRKLRSLQRSINRKQRPLSRQSYQPNLENLEDRLAPATITVNDVSDGLYNPPTVLPGALGQRVSLRDAINAANNDTTGSNATDTIVLLPGTYYLNNVDNRALGANALPVITGHIIIEDAGSLPVVLSVAGPSMRVFDVECDGHDIASLTLQGLTITGGTAQGANGGNGAGGGGGAAGLGGAIFNEGGSLSLFDCTLLGNSAIGGAGGNVTSGNGGTGGGPAGGAGSSISALNGSAGAFGSGGGGAGVGGIGGNGGFGAGSGGGASAAGTAGFGGGAGGLAGGGGAALGGAIFNDEGVLTIINSTITGNSATAGASGTGGAGSPGSALAAGIFNYNGTLDSFNDTIVSNTLNGNVVAQSASDVYNLGNAATDTQQGTVSQGALTETLTFPTAGPQPNVIINTANLTGTPAASVVTTTAGALPLTAAVQTLSFGGSITGGYFTLTLGGAGGPTTAPIAWTDSPAGLAANIHSALHNLDAAWNVAASEGTTTDGFAGAVSATLVFSDPTATEASTQIIMYNQTVDADGNLDNFLTGTYSMASNLAVAGLQTIAFNGNVTGGSFALGFTFPIGTPPVNTVIATNQIAWTDNPIVLAANVQSAVNNLFAIVDPSDSVSVGAATVEHLAFPTSGPQQPVFVNTSNLTGTPTAAVTNVAAGALPDVDAAQAIEFTGNITGGTFTLTFSGLNGVAGTDTTAPIAWDANPSTMAANIRFAIDNLLDGLSPSVSAGTLVDTIAYPFPSHLTLTGEASGLITGGNGAPSVNVTVNSSIATVTFGGDIVGGSFDLVDGTHTAQITWSSNPATLAANIQAALNALAPSMTAVDMTNTIVGQYVDNTINGGSNYATGSNNLALIASVAAGQTLTFTTAASLGLGALANNGGFTQTMALFDSSPAANAGANLTALFSTYGQAATDQRGNNRGTVWSIGSYQDSTPGLPAVITLVAGSAKSGTVSTPYARTLTVLVTDAFGAPVSGVTVTFNGPTTGAGVTFTTKVVTVLPSGKTSTATHAGTHGVIAVTNSNGEATASLTANAKVGTFTVTITANGVSTPVTVSLTNLAVVHAAPALRPRASN